MGKREDRRYGWRLAVLTFVLLCLQGTGGQAYAQALASQGYLAVCFDFRGGGPGSQSDGSPLEMTIFTEQQDLEAEIAMLRARKR